MTIKEMQKYGFYCQNKNLRVKRVLIAEQENDIIDIEKMMNCKNHVVISNITLEEIGKHLNLFFQVFSNKKVECIFYLISKESLYFLNVDEFPTKEELEHYLNLKDRIDSLPISYSIGVKELMEEISHFSQREMDLIEKLNCFADMVQGVEFKLQDGTMSFPYYQNEDAMISLYYDKNYTLDKEDELIQKLVEKNGNMAISLASQLQEIQSMIYKEEPIFLTNELFLDLKGKDTKLCDGKKEMGIQDLFKFGSYFPKQAKFMKRVEDVEINLIGLPIKLQEYLYQKDQQKIKKNGKELLYKNKMIQ